jgi:hypothetical protein
LTVEVYRHVQDGKVEDFTAGGLSAYADRLTVVGTVPTRATPGALVTPMPEDSRVFGERADAPAFALRYTNGGDGTVCLVPVLMGTAGYQTRAGWHMAGGNYAGTTDSRWSALVSKMTGHRFYGLVAIHDRIES